MADKVLPQRVSAAFLMMKQAKSAGFSPRLGCTDVSGQGFKKGVERSLGSRALSDVGDEGRQDPLCS